MNERAIRKLEGIRDRCLQLASGSKLRRGYWESQAAIWDYALQAVKEVKKLSNAEVVRRLREIEP